jgi:hypothetical protein
MEWLKTRPFLWGFLGAVTGLLLGILIGLAVIVWVRAANGQQAFDYLARELAKQQQQVKPAQVPGKE